MFCSYTIHEKELRCLYSITTFDILYRNLEGLHLFTAVLGWLFNEWWSRLSTNTTDAFYIDTGLVVRELCRSYFKLSPLLLIRIDLAGINEFSDVHKLSHSTHKHFVTNAYGTWSGRQIWIFVGSCLRRPSSRNMCILVPSLDVQRRQSS